MSANEFATPFLNFPNMKKLLTFALLFTSSFLFGQLAGETNPPAPGFNAAASDAKAIAIADEVMQAMGGRQAWDDTRFITWKFFGRRMLIWDKHKGKVRVESGDDIYLVDIFNNTGKVKMGDKVLEHPDSVAKYVERGISIWINDSYWLVMPFKLKDSGVTLKYVGEGKTAAGAAADILQLTFEDVGRTPDNKYHVYVDKTSRLITQWDFYTDYNDEKPRFTTPWANYQPYSGIMLSDSRGERGHTDVGVYEFIPASVFTSFEPVDYSKFK
jgi:plasmid maintenance system killer protein